MPAMTVKRVSCLDKQRYRNTRPEDQTGQLRRITKRQDRCLRQLDQTTRRHHFATTLQIADQWFGKEGRSATMRTQYRRIRAFGLFSYRP